MQVPDLMVKVPGSSIGAAKVSAWYMLYCKADKGKRKRSRSGDDKRWGRGGKSESICWMDGRQRYKELEKWARLKVLFVKEAKTTGTYWTNTEYVDFDDLFWEGDDIQCYDTETLGLQATYRRFWTETNCHSITNQPARCFFFVLCLKHTFIYFSLSKMSLCFSSLLSVLKNWIPWVLDCRSDQTKNFNMSA